MAQHNPSNPSPNSNLSQFVSALFDIAEDHQIGIELDAGFDGGEFSTPAHYEQMDREIEQLAKDFGYKSLFAAVAEVRARTSDRWCYFNLGFLND